MEKGGAIAAASFSALSARLALAMEEGGPSYAAAFCTIAAPLITDSMSGVHGVHVKRTSDRLRGPHNAPDTHEKERLNEALLRIAQGTPPAELGDQVFVLGDSIAFYRPIIIAMPLCLACHGEPGETLDSAAHAVIRERYPADAAIGYRPGDFRGLWSIRWPR